MGMAGSDPIDELDAAAALAGFSSPTRQWFQEALGTPTLPQVRAWPLVREHHSVVVCAQTGSGKTLAAFLAVIDRWVQESSSSAAPSPSTIATGTRVVYVSPLKALATDVERNLQAPLAGIARCAAVQGLAVRLPSVAVRTGDTDARERARYRRHPAELLITTPESLALLLTSQAAAGLATVETVIIDEIHALVSTKRGAHLALTLERLEDLCRGAGGSRPLQRIGLSATLRPLSEAARFLGGVDPVTREPRPVTVVDARSDKALDVSVVSTLADADAALAPIPQAPVPMPSVLLGTALAPSIVVGAPAGSWAIIPPRITSLARRHRTILVFVNARRLAERLAASINDVWVAEESADGRAPPAGAVLPLALAHHGSLARAQRLQVEEAVKRGEVRVLVATSSMELGVDLPFVDVVVQIDAPPSVAAALQRVGRAGHQVASVSRGVLMPRIPMDLLACAAIVPGMHQGEVEATRLVHTPLDVLAQHLVGIVAVAPRTPTSLYTLATSAAPWSTLSRATFDAVVQMLCGQAAIALGLEGHDGLRGRLRLDVATGALVPKPGAHRVAVQNVGTIADRGLYGVYLMSGDDEVGQKVGELDEEMVFESRPGEVIRLGSSSWRIERITADRVIVTPAPGLPGKLPFWRGESPLRPLELGRRMAALCRELSEAPMHEARAQLGRSGFDDDAATALVDFLRRQRAASGGVIPTDTTVVIERNRDELMDWRVVLLSPLGGAVFQPLALAMSFLARSEHGLDLEVTVTNDGILCRFPESDEAPDLLALLPRAADLERVVVAALGETPLFSARFREAAARALVLPRPSLKRRTALWKQRQRAADLLRVVKDRPEFPLTLEAARELLRDVFDMAGLTSLLTALEEGRARAVTIDTDVPSPMAADIIHAMVRTSIYEDDVPAAERKARALSIDPSALRELLGDGALRELLDTDVIAAVEAVLQRTAPSLLCRHADDVHDLLIRLGALSIEALSKRVRADAQLALHLGINRVGHHAARETTGPTHDDVEERRRVASLLVDELIVQGRVILVRVAGEARVIAIEDAGRYAHGLGVVLPPGVPIAFTDGGTEPLTALVRRDVSTHALSTAADVAARMGIHVDAAAAMLDELVRREQLVKGAFLPGGQAVDYTTSDTLQSLRRRTLSALRQQAAPVDEETFVRARLRAAGVVPIPSAPGVSLTTAGAVGAGGGPLERLREVVLLVQGLSLPWSIVERFVLPARLPGYRPEHLDALLAAGEVVWIGDGARGEHDGNVRLFFADAVAALWTPPTGAPVESTAERAAASDVDGRVWRALQARGASFVAALADAASPVVESALSTSRHRPGGPPSFSLWQAARRGAAWSSSSPSSSSSLSSSSAAAAAPPAVLEAVWRLVWQGLVTSDGVGALRARAGKRRAARRRGERFRPGSLSSVGGSTVSGRFSLTQTLVVGRMVPSPTERAVAVAEQLLWSCGLLDNELVTAMSRGLAEASAVKAALRAMEDQGTIRRGFFVEGAAGLQYGTPQAIEALRTERQRADDDDVFVLAALDPAQPFGLDRPWPTPTSIRGGDVPSPQRAVNAVAIIAGGRLVGLVLGEGRSLVTFLADVEPDRARHAHALARGLAHIAAASWLAGRASRFLLATVDGCDATASEFSTHPLRRALEQVGFMKSAGGWIWPPPRSGPARSVSTLPGVAAAGGARGVDAVARHPSPGHVIVDEDFDTVEDDDAYDDAHEHDDDADDESG